LARERAPVLREPARQVLSVLPLKRRQLLLGGGALALAGCGTPRAAWPGLPAEVRGTWLTTTANDAIASPANTAASMQALAAMGLNTVYVESWKNGYTQWPSTVLKRTIGVAQRPAGALQDPSDAASLGAPPAARNLLEESLIEAHRHGLLHVAWMEYGFMAAHGGTQNHLRRQKREWLSLDAQGGEVAPNGFVWMNPLHPAARQFLLDLTLEAAALHDLDGIQFDDRIVWPYVTMGYDATTRAAYAAAHAGREPPRNPRDAAWMRWRADQLNALAQDFVRSLRAGVPGLLLSLSPAVYPWSYEHYLLEWPQWGRWPAAARWDEFVPQNYRFNYPAFETTWREQVQALQAASAYRPRELLAGIRIDGGGDPSGWAQLQHSIQLTRSMGQGGHVLWFSKGVLGLHRQALQQLYAHSGPARSPHFPPGWRRPALVPQRVADAQWVLDAASWAAAQQPLQRGAPLARRWRVIGHDGRRWQYLQDLEAGSAQAPTGQMLQLHADARFGRVELLVDRRGDTRYSP
jgi:uncharacterized lipoprotein YddW (UPF0748 family)